VKQQVQLSRGVTTFYLRYPRKKLNKYHNPYAPPGLAGEWPPPEDATGIVVPVLALGQSFFVAHEVDIFCGATCS